MKIDELTEELTTKINELTECVCWAALLVSAVLLMAYCSPRQLSGESDFSDGPAQSQEAK